MTTALIDGDLVCYRSAASAEKDEENIALIRANRTLQDIVSVTDASDVKLFLSGTANFRYGLYPEYKANRKDMVRPRHLELVREFLVTKWTCSVTDGIEADDALGIAHQAAPGSVLVSIDKDLLQLPGHHYDFVKLIWREIDELQGLRNFYTQLIEGDASDNIPAWDGKLRTSRPKFVQKLIDPLYETEDEKDMYCYVESLYGNKQLEQMLLNAQLLYIHKKEGDRWNPPIMMDNGVQEDSKTLFDQLSAVPRNAGLQNTSVLP